MKTTSCIKQYNMASRLQNITELYSVLKSWRKEYPKVFRIDGHDAIGPANPSQWIFFEINEFSKDQFSGTEFGKKIDGSVWNGIYYLTASTRGSSIDAFISSYEKTQTKNDIFQLAYTTKKEGIPSKRRLLLKNQNEEINSGWFCKQYFKKY